MMTSRHCSRILSLTGFMGCGKSTVGRMIASKLGAEYIDLDSVIEERAGCSIPEIFERIGEYGFRAIERMTLEFVLNSLTNNGKQSRKTEGNCYTVLSLGGGTLSTPECLQMIERYTNCIYLKASAKTLMHNLSNECEGRPMLEGCTNEADLMERIESLMNQRSSIYDKAGKIRIEIDGKTPEIIVNEILKSIHI